MEKSLRLAFLGAGNMGSALIGGLLKTGFVSAQNVVATVRSEERAVEVRTKYAIPVTAGGNREAAHQADVVILATKPHVTPKVMDEIHEQLRPNQLLISLAAALPLRVLDAKARKAMPIFRAIPNLPVIVEEGATAICHNSHTTASQRDYVNKLFSSVGVAVEVEEDQLDAVTGLSGSGPAYVYMVIEAFIAGGLKMGLSREISTKLAEQTVLGAAKHVRTTGLHPAILRDEVITPGGTTIVAIHELERLGLRSMLISAIESATKHARERGKALVAKVENE